MGKLKDKILSQPGIYITYLYIFIMLIIFPYYNTKKFFNLDEDKTNFFVTATTIYIFLLIPVAFNCILNRKKQLKFPKFGFKRIDAIFAAIFLSAVILSTIFSFDIKKSILGLVSRNVSSLCLLLSVAVFFAVRKYGIFSKILLWGWMVGSSIIYIIGIFCACGINFMHLQDGIIQKELYMFLTPLSNIDCNTCYACLALPPIMVMYMICQDSVSQILYGIYIYIGFLFVYFIKTDSVLLTFLISFVILAYFSLENPYWSGRYIQIAGIYIGAKVTVKILLYIFENKLLPFHGTHLLLLSNKALAMNILCLLLLVIIHKWKNGFLRNKISAARKYLVVTAIAVGIFAIFFTIYINIIGERIPENSIFKHLIFTNKTFNGRGFMWKRTFHRYVAASPLRKLFGCGPNCFKNFMGPDGYTLSLGTINDPHNELLQITANLGLIGSIGYFGLLISTLIKSLKNWRKNNLQIVTALTISLFLIQGLVNACAIYHLPLLFIFLGLANGSIQNNTSGTI